MTQTIAIVCKPRHPRSKEVVKDALLILKKYPVNIIVDEETHANLTSLFNNEDNITTCSRENLTTHSNLVLVFGGDGTLISVCRHARKQNGKSAKVLGINLGTLGFLTEIPPERLKEALDYYFTGITNSSVTPLLEIVVAQDSNAKLNAGKYYALNDVVINKQALARIFVLGLKVNDTFASNIRGDGVIISTPNGSTAYSLAAGGSIVHPEVDALLITPICPHSLSSRPIVIPGNAEICLELGPDSRAEDVYLTIDGQEGTAIHKGTKVTIRKSSNYVEFLRLPTSNYFANLSNKLRWG